MKAKNEIIAHNVRLLRGITKLNQQEFGALYGIDQKSISVYETGAHRPKPDFLLRLSRGAGISADRLLTLKLKKNAEGKIINLPNEEKELREIRMQLKKAFAKFRLQVDIFEEELQFLNERIDAIEKQKK